MCPSRSNETISFPVSTLRMGRPNRFASAGVSKDELRPRDTAVTESSACPVNLADADTFSVMTFPALRFLYECRYEPVVQKGHGPVRGLEYLDEFLIDRGG